MGSSRDRTLRSALPAPDGALSEREAPPPTWGGDVLIPITQNLLSGAAWAGGVAIGWFWLAGGGLPDFAPAACASVGGLWAIAWTIVRYNGDEIGLFRGAYQAGRRSRDAEVNYLLMQLKTLHDATTAAAGSVTSTEAEKRLAVANATLHNARALLRVIYEHGAKHGSREEMAGRGIGQRDWERARALCVASGAVDGLLQPLLGNYADALKAAERTHGAGVAEMRKSRTHHPAWT